MANAAPGRLWQAPNPCIPLYTRCNCRSTVCNGAQAAPGLGAFCPLSFRRRTRLCTRQHFQGSSRSLSQRRTARSAAGACERARIVALGELDGLAVACTRSWPILECGGGIPTLPHTLPKPALCRRRLPTLSTPPSAGVAGCAKLPTGVRQDGGRPGQPSGVL